MTAATFHDFIRGLGFQPPERIEPGRWIPFGTNGKPNDTAGRVRLFPDGEGGLVYDWRSGESWTWQKRDRPLTPAETDAWRSKIERNKREAESERRRAETQTAERAAEIWRAATPADDSHGYLRRKGVKAHGLRIYRGPLAFSGLRCDGSLIVPARNASGDVVSLSFVAADGEKRYLAGPKPAGHYYSIGKPRGVICVAEGYATGASIHEATGHAVAVAFNAGNLQPTARALRDKYPDARLIFCADDDSRSAGNPGLTQATEAARIVGGLVAVPDFGADGPGDATDFNDLAASIGLDAVRRCIESARQPDVSKAQPGHPNATAAAVEGVELIRADTIKPEAIDWLWDGYLAAGKVHIIAGAPGTGKTTLAVGLMATLTCGGRWPDSSRALAGSGLIWSGEDSAADTLVPRLIASHANLSRVHFVGERRTGEGSRYFDPAQDFEALAAEAARIPDLRLVIVDPIVSAVSGDSNKNAEVRRALQPLVRFADRLGCAVLGISHYSKGTAGRDPVERVTGSVAFGALARLVFGTAKVPEEDGGGRILVRAKSNIGPDGGGFKYELRQVEIAPGIAASRPDWLGALEGEARELLAVAEAQSDPGERSATDEAAERLRELIEEANGSVKTRDARKVLKAEGFTEKQIRTARERLGVKRSRDGFGGVDYWYLPGRSCPPNTVHAQQEREGTNGQERQAEGMNDSESIEAQR